MKTDPIFERQFAAVFGREGALKYTSPQQAERIKDLGGETLGGIARNKRPDWPGWPLVDRLNAAGVLGTVLKTTNSAEAQELTALIKDDYQANYWDRLGLGSVPEPLAEVLFDGAINQGTGATAKLLQRCLNVLNREAKDYPDVTVDGDLGPATRAALQAYLKARSLDGLNVLRTALLCLRGARYVERAEERPDQEANVYGWLRARVAEFIQLPSGTTCASGGVGEASTTRRASS